MLEEAEALLLDPQEDFEHCLIGVARRFSAVVALYDQAKVLEVYRKRDGMTHEGAIEFFEFNTVGAWMGEGTPVFAILEDPTA